MYRRNFFLLLILLGIIHSNASRRLSQYPPTHFFVFGDRFSGVEYLSNILRESLNLQQCNVNSRANASWKSSFLTLKELDQNLDCNMDKTIVILITKDPFAWLQSVAQRKYSSDDGKVISSMYMLALISNRYRDNLELNTGSGKISTTSIIKLRTRKLKSYLSIVKKLTHASIVRYEDLLQDAERAVRDALRGKGLTAASFNATSLAFHNNKRSRKKKYYLEKKYLDAYNTKAIDRTIKKLDKYLETRRLGYQIPPRDGWISLKEQKFRQKEWYKRCWHRSMDLLQWVIVPTVALILLSIIVIIFRDVQTYLSSLLFSKEMCTGTKVPPMNRSNDEIPWTQVKEKTTGRMYYTNKSTGHLQWKRPRRFVPYGRNDKLE